MTFYRFECKFFKENVRLMYRAYVGQEVKEEVKVLQSKRAYAAHRNEMI
jgi:hypothetical protein